MASKEYAEKLKDPRWQKKRLQVFERDGWKCTKCGCDHKELHVHHKRYIAGRDPWEYADHYLTTVCHGCHENEHANEAKHVAAPNAPTLHDYLPGGRFVALLTQVERDQAEAIHASHVAANRRRAEILQAATRLAQFGPY